MALLTLDAAPEPQAPVRLGYVASLDGLRALAALAVVAYHVEAGPLRGGFLGVDVFFVLSGFLITRLLLEERAGHGRVSLRRFWARRARRLLPAIAVVVAAVCTWSWFTQGAVARRQTAGDAVASLLYVANWRFIRESSSYFAPLLEASPLRHLWSLSVEEQWYLVWPVVVAVVARVAGPRLLAAVCALGALASAAWMVHLVTVADLDRAYYGTDSRAHSLLVGSLLATATVAWPRLEDRFAGCTGNRVGLVGLGILAVTVASAGASDAWLYRGGFLAVALAAAGVVGWLALGLPSPVHRALGSGPMVWLGKRSYALYLWHWPVVVALTPDVVGITGAPLGLLQAALSVGLAALSFRLVEEPVRAGMGGRAGLVATGALMGGAGVVAVGLLLSGVALPSQRPGDVLALVPVTVERAPTSTAPSGAPVPTAVAPEPLVPDPLAVTILGDSQAFVMALDTAEHGLAPALRLSAWATIGCGVGSAVVVSGGRDLPYPGEACDRWPDEWARTVVESEPDVVVLALGAWEVADVRVGDTVLAFGTAAHDEWLLGRLRLAFDAASAAGAPVVALEVPCYDAVPGEFTMAAERNDLGRVTHVNALLRQVAEERGQVVAPHWSFACRGAVERRLPDGERLRYDGVHYTPEGARAMWEWLLPILHDVVDHPTPT